MSEPVTTPVSEVDASEQTALGRRRLLRGGALAAGAGVAAALLASPRAASAADGDPLLVGRTTEAGTSTTLRAGGLGRAPGLVVEKTASGPHLRLTPNERTSLAEAGEIQFTTEVGPVIGIEYEQGVVTTDYLATGLDLDQLAVYEVAQPARLLDTRTVAGRQGILQTSPNAFDANFRLRAGAWVDLEVGALSEPPVEAAFVNVTAVGPTGAGYLAAYPSGPRPNVSTVNFGANQVIANGVFVGTGVIGSSYAIRVYASVASHVLVDLAGRSVLGLNGVSSTTVLNQRRGARRSPARRVVRTRAVRR